MHYMRSIKISLKFSLNDNLEDITLEHSFIQQHFDKGIKDHRYILIVYIPLILRLTKLTL